MPLRVEGAARTMRGVPSSVAVVSWRRCSSREAIGLVLADGRGTGRYGEHRMRPVTGAAGRGSSARLVGFRPKGVTKAAAPPTASRPALNPAAYGGPLWPLIPFRLDRTRCSRLTSRPSARRAEGAPLKP